MPYITNKDVERLIAAETYLWENSDWRENKEMERALWNIWKTVENMACKKYRDNKRSKEYMRKKREEDPQYGRSKK